MNSFKNNNILDYEIYFNEAGSCQMEGIISLYNYINGFLVSILFIVTTSLFVITSTHISAERHIKQIKEEEDLFELVNWMRFLQKWTHSTNLELIWTVIPTIILLAIAVPSFILLYSLDEIVDTQCVVRIVAYQWYWKYEYPALDSSSEDVLSLSYLSYMLPIDDLTEENNLRLLEVDSPLILPINVNSKLIITSKDVIHSFAIPSLGIKMDAVPGRLNQVTAHIFKPGVYYGQCSELCGVNHAFMPIVINAVHFSTFDSFLFHGSTNSTFTPSFPGKESDPHIENYSSENEFKITLNFLEAYLNYVKAANQLEIQNTCMALYDVVNQRNAIFKKALTLADAYELVGSVPGGECTGCVDSQKNLLKRSELLKSMVLKIYLLEHRNMYFNEDIIIAEAALGHFGGLVRQALSNPFIDYALLSIETPLNVYVTFTLTFLGYSYPEESVFNVKKLYVYGTFFQPSDFESEVVKPILFDIDNVEKFLKNKYCYEPQSIPFYLYTLLQTDSSAVYEASLPEFFYFSYDLNIKPEEESDYSASKVKELKESFQPLFEGEQKPFTCFDQVPVTFEEMLPLIVAYLPLYELILDIHDSETVEPLVFTGQFFDFLLDLFYAEPKIKLKVEEYN